MVMVNCAVPDQMPLFALNTGISMKHNNNNNNNNNSNNNNNNNNNNKL